MQRRARRVKEGVVTGHGMDKTAVVCVSRVFAHPHYLKTVKVSKKFLAHDEKNEAKVGDLVQIMEIRPISKRKFHRILKVLGQTKVKMRELPRKKEKEEEKTQSDTAAD